MVAEVRYGVQTINHVAVPVRDWARNRDFYQNALGLKYQSTRKNPDGSPSQTDMLAGLNIIGLQLPRSSAGSSSSAGPRIGIGLPAARFSQAQEQLRAANHRFTGPVEHGPEGPLARSIYLDDPDGNHLELCVRRVEPLHECISHIVFETRDLRKAIPFYIEALGTGVPMSCGDETMIPVQSGQMIGLVAVGERSNRSKNHRRGCQMTMEVQQEDFDSMAALVERYGGKTQGDNRADSGLRPDAERSLHFNDPDNNRLQITARAPINLQSGYPTKNSGAASSPVATHRGRGSSRWESGGKKLV